MQYQQNTITTKNTEATMSNNKQTAVEWLVKEFSEILGPLKTKPMQDLLIVDAINQAKQMEKEQSLNFAKHCLDKAKDLDVRTAFLNVEQYYETFKTKNQ